MSDAAGVAWGGIVDQQPSHAETGIESHPLFH